MIQSQRNSSSTYRDSSNPFDSDGAWHMYWLINFSGLDINKCAVNEYKFELLISFKSSLSLLTYLRWYALVNANGIFCCLSLQQLYCFPPVHCSRLTCSTSQYLTSWSHNSHAIMISSDASKSLMHLFIALYHPSILTHSQDLPCTSPSSVSWPLLAKVIALMSNSFQGSVQLPGTPSKIMTRS